MARVHYWSFLVNAEGQPIEGAEISIYLAGSDTDVLLYLDEFSSTSTSTAPQLNTSTNGFFEFWLPDPNSTVGYSTTQKFKLSWSKTGIASGFIDYVDMYSTNIPVNESDSTNTDKDKSVSNSLAYLWESHRLDETHKIHGIEEVDVLDSVNIVKNKLISNMIGFNWNKHYSLTFATSGVSGSTYVIGTSATSADYPHGIKPLKTSDAILITDPEYWSKNRVISHNDGKTWTDHVNSPTGHGISEVDENDTNTDKNKVVSNYLMNYLLYKTRHNETILSHTWTSSGGNFIKDITHDLVEHFPSVQVWNSDTKLQVTPLSIKSISSSVIRIENSVNINAEVIILK